MDTDVAFTQEYSRVSISMRKSKCSSKNQGLQGKDRKVFLWVERDFLWLILDDYGSGLLYFTYFGATRPF